MRQEPLVGNHAAPLGACGVWCMWGVAPVALAAWGACRLQHSAPAALAAGGACRLRRLATVARSAWSGGAWLRRLPTLTTCSNMPCTTFIPTIVCLVWLLEAFDEPETVFSERSQSEIIATYHFWSR